MMRATTYRSSQVTVGYNEWNNSIEVQDDVEHIGRKGSDGVEGGVLYKRGCIDDASTGDVEYNEKHSGDDSRVDVVDQYA